MPASYHECDHVEIFTIACARCGQICIRSLSYNYTYNPTSITAQGSRIKHHLHFQHLHQGKNYNTKGRKNTNRGYGKQFARVRELNSIIHHFLNGMKIIYFTNTTNYSTLMLIMCVNAHFVS